MSANKDPRDEMWELRVKEKKDQLATELVRYKQDCRKKALEMANREAPQICLKDEWLPSSDDMINKADKYYEWLTKDLS